MNRRDLLKASIAALAAGTPLGALASIVEKKNQPVWYSPYHSPISWQIPKKRYSLMVITPPKSKEINGEECKRMIYVLTGEWEFNYSSQKWITDDDKPTLTAFLPGYIKRDGTGEQLQYGRHLLYWGEPFGSYRMHVNDFLQRARIYNKNEKNEKMKTLEHSLFLFKDENDLKRIINSTNILRKQIEFFPDGTAFWAVEANKGKMFGQWLYLDNIR